MHKRSRKLPQSLNPDISAAYLKFPPRTRQILSGEFEHRSRQRKFASDGDFLKFVKGGCRDVAGNPERGREDLPFTKTSNLSGYQGRMIASLFRFPVPVPQTLAAALLAALGAGLAGCADMSDGMTSAFADPAKYQLWNCKQLEGERKTQAKRLAELQGLMAKAQTGVGGSVVAELAYRNDYIAVRGQAKNADEAWARNKCRESPPEPAKDSPKEGAKAEALPAPAANERSGRSQTKSGNAIY